MANHVKCIIHKTIWERSKAGRYDSTKAICSICKKSTTSYGSGDNSVKRCLVLLKESCAMEGHFYVADVTLESRKYKGATSTTAHKDGEVINELDKEKPKVSSSTTKTSQKNNNGIPSEFETIYVRAVNSNKDYSRPIIVHRPVNQSKLPKQFVLWVYENAFDKGDIVRNTELNLYAEYKSDFLNNILIGFRKKLDYGYCIIVEETKEIQDLFQQDQEEKYLNEKIDESWIDRLFAWADDKFVSNPDDEEDEYLMFKAGHLFSADYPHDEMSRCKLLAASHHGTGLTRSNIKIKQIEELDLDGFELTIIPPELGGLKSLRKLILGKKRVYYADIESGGNSLTHLPNEIGSLEKLQELLIESNEIIELPSEIGQLQNLTHLSLDYNKLSSLPPEIGQLQNLTHLSLDYNNLSSLPSEIGQLQNLTHLSLDYNNLSSLPSEIGQLQNLTHLNLSNHKLSSLPSEIGNLTKLTELELDCHELCTLPSWIGQLTNLTKLYLSGKELTTLPAEIGQLTKLTHLKLFNHQLTTLPNEIGQLINLTSLSLNSGFQVQSLTSFTSFPQGLFKLSKLDDISRKELLKEISIILHIE
jgi:Leucine-rich repeat (LRR) protein